MSNEFLMIEDIAFETAVKEELNLTDKDNILLKDVEKIRKLDLSSLDINSIKGIEKLKRLSSLDLSYNKISDISYLENLKLDSLIIKDCENIKDISVLSRGEIQKYIKKLDLSLIWVKDFDFLSKLPKLEVLYLNNMWIDEFSSLPSMENLKKLYLEDNDLENLENPPYIPNLEEIYLSRNQLTYIEGIENYKKLKKIRISYNKIETIFSLKGFKELKKLYMSHNQIVDLSPLKNIIITEKLALDANNIMDVKPIKTLMDSDLDIFGLELIGIIRATEEQRKIIGYSFENNDILKANAYAGTGKTTTAIQFIENYDIAENKKILYLTFNKSVKDDIDRKIPNKLKTIVEARTAHSLAWGYLKLSSRSEKIIWLNINASFIRDYLYFDFLDKKEALKDARIIDQFIKFYLNSDYSYQAKDIKDAFEEFIIGDDRIKAKEDDDLALLLVGAVKTLELLLRKLQKRELSHDFYLKLFHLTLRNHISKLNNIYQLVIFDEAQDASMVMYDTVKKMNTKKLFIGDSHQEIYSFRHAVNILNKIDVKPLELTHSFRFGKNIAQLANNILSLKGVKSNIKGRGSDEILFYDVKNGLIARNDKFTVISRTNVPLFIHAYEAVKNNKKIYFEGNVEYYPFASARAKSIYYLNKEGESGKVSDSFIRSFNNISKLKAYAMEAQDFQLLGLIQLIQLYSDNFLKVLRAIRFKIVEKDNADIIFTTVHKSKGVEYDRVMIIDDFKIEPFKIGADYEEVNLLYVAVTRAKNLLFLPKPYQGFLDVNIDKTVEAISKLSDEIEKKETVKRKIKIDLSRLSGFEKLLNRIYDLPMSKEGNVSSGNLDIAKKLILANISLEIISQTTGIDIEILKKL